jgi:hypothetical protein
MHSAIRLACASKLAAHKTNASWMLHAVQESARSEGHAVGIASGHTYLDVLRDALQVIIELAVPHLAGADARDELGLPGVVCASEESVTAGMGCVADGDGTSVAVAADVIGTAAGGTHGDQRHFESDGLHESISFPVADDLDRHPFAAFRSAPIPARQWNTRK